MDKDRISNSLPPLIHAIVDGMEEVKARNIQILNLKNLENSVCDYFVICEGTSNTQVKAISESIEKSVRENLSEKPWHVEGQSTAEWVLMDYVNIVAHIFQRETREFYELEGLWGDAEVTVLEENY